MGRIIVAKASRSLICEIARFYTTDPYSTFEAIAKHYGVRRETISRLLFRGIAESILSDYTSEKIHKKVVNAFGLGKTKRDNYWIQAFELRADNENQIKKAKTIAELKKQKKEQKVAQRALLQFQIDSFDDYCIEEEGAPTKELLANELEELDKIN